VGRPGLHLKPSAFSVFCPCSILVSFVLFSIFPDNYAMFSVSSLNVGFPPPSFFAPLTFLLFPNYFPANPTRLSLLILVKLFSLHISQSRFNCVHALSLPFSHSRPLPLYAMSKPFVYPLPLVFPDYFFQSPEAEISSTVGD